MSSNTRKKVKNNNLLKQKRLSKKTQLLQKNFILESFTKEDLFEHLVLFW